MVKDSFLQIRNYKEYDDDQYLVLDIAWPVELFECSANARIQKELDCLAESVLRFMELGIWQNALIAKALFVSSDLIQSIKQQLFEKEFICEDMQQLSDMGKNYFIRTDEIMYSKKMTFGYMAMSLFDGSIMPYFSKGKLPLLGGFPEGIAKIVLPYDDESERDFISPISGKNEVRFTEAYRNFCKIVDTSRDIASHEEWEYVASHHSNVSCEDAYDDSQVKTIAYTLREDDISSSEVNILKKEGLRIYILLKLVINRYNTSNMQFLSPFPENITTTWYNRKLAYFMEKHNHIEVNVNGEYIPFPEYIDRQIQQVIIEIPEVQSDDYESCIKMNYPMLNLAPRLKNNIESLLIEYYTCVQLYKEETIGGMNIIMVGAKLIETLLNNFIHLIHDRHMIVNTRIFGYEPYDLSQIDTIFNRLSITECFAKNLATGLLREMTDRQRGWAGTRRVGNTITARYFFLILEGFIIGKNPFNKVLKDNAQAIVYALDSISDIRNKEGAHNDKEYYKSISPGSIDDFMKKTLMVATKMVAVLAEEEK
jgi:hypothetical protein